MRKITSLGILTLLVFALSTSTASATSISYQLTSDFCTGGCGTSPFGVVTLNDFGSTGDVFVTLTLSNGNKLVDTGSAGAFAFNLKEDPAISVTGLTSGFALVSATADDYHFSGLGFFDYAISGPGPSAPYSGTLSFHVLAPGITVTSFADLSTLPAAQQAYVVADILASNGNTGRVGAEAACTENCTQELISNPEPVSLLLLATGLTMAAGMVRRRRV